MKSNKSLPVEFDAKSVRNDGSFSGYASTFGNVDSYGDIVMPGSFIKSLSVRPPQKVKMLWQHDSAQPIGVWNTIQEDSKGLFVKGKILKEIAKGAEAYALMKEGVIDSMSIGYMTMESEYTKNGTRQLKELGLMEVSLVTFPANDQATVTSLKELNPRELEKSLRDEGFSWASATKAVALFREHLRDGGANVDIGPRDEDAATQTATLAAALRKLETTLRA